MTGYPRPLTAIHQVEITTFCSLRCPYCPSPKLEQIRGQEKQHMTREVWEQTLDLCKRLPANERGELSITGIGETLLHPEWREFVAMAREALPEAFINFSTNGLALDDEACEVLAQHNIKVFVSLHRPEKAGPAINAAKRHGIYLQENASASIAAMDWAGQVDWEVSADAVRCDWLYYGWGAVMVDGRISNCCLDASGKGVIGTVYDDPKDLLLAPFSLCTDCHQVPPLPNELPQVGSWMPR